MLATVIGVKIGVPLQTSVSERRVALTPDIAGKLVSAGHDVVVEAGAGSAAGNPDAEYTDRGARIVSADEAWSADLVVVIVPPDPPGRAGGSTVLGFLSPFDRPEAMAATAAAGTTAFAFEAVPRTTRAQTVDALSSQATVAGYQAVLEAATHSNRFFPMLTTAAGTIRPAKVLVLGAGVAGLQAIATARRLGAVVSAFDVRSEAAEQVGSLGASFLRLDVRDQDSSASGGYAREVAEDEQRRILDGLAPHVAASDAVICTAAIPGRPAPLLVTREAVEQMRPGSVIVDLAASTGGNCELTSLGETVTHDGVTIVGVTDLVSRVANHASQMYARNVAAFIELITADDGSLAPDWDDEIVRGSCITRDGEIVHPRVREIVEQGAS